ncbi:MAG: UDP-N-acetylglucosamine 1-carboxyvinyltransferase, partial [Ardenticatenaceae bacterium]
MNRFVIEGQRTISGAIEPRGSKNAALPAIAATLLTDEPVVLRRLPGIADVDVMVQLAHDLGSEISLNGDHSARLRAKDLVHCEPNRALCRSIRALFLLAGPLLARCGRAVLPRPGGDKIGRRPLDTHVEAFQQMGVEVELSPDSYYLA